MNKKFNEKEKIINEEMDYISICNKKKIKPKLSLVYSFNEESCAKLLFKEKNEEISNNEAECIGKALKNIKKFEEVDFSYMKLTNLGFNKIIEGINPENLKVLNISGIVLTQENVLQLSNTILNFTETKTNISSLIAYSCNIGDDGVKTLCSNLSKDGCILKSLDLRDNNITETGFVYIAGMLTFNKSIEKLNLSLNNCGDDGMIALSSSLQMNNTLKIIDLSNNNIGDLGCKVICKSLISSTAFGKHSIYSSFKIKEKNSKEPNKETATKQKNKIMNNEMVNESGEITQKTMSGIRVLNLRDNIIGDNGASSIGLMLSKFPCVALYLGMNKITSLGLNSIMKSLEKNPYLFILDVENIKLNKEGAFAVKTSLENNKNLKKLYIDINDEKEAKTISEGLMSNTTLISFVYNMSQIESKKNTKGDVIISENINNPWPFDTPISKKLIFENNLKIQKNNLNGENINSSTTSSNLNTQITSSKNLSSSPNKKSTLQRLQNSSPSSNSSLNKNLNISFKQGNCTKSNILESTLLTNSYEPISSDIIDEIESSLKINRFIHSLILNEKKVTEENKSIKNLFFTNELLLKNSLEDKEEEEKEGAHFVRNEIIDDKEANDLNSSNIKNKEIYLKEFIEWVGCDNPSFIIPSEDLIILSESKYVGIKQILSQFSILYCNDEAFNSQISPSLLYSTTNSTKIIEKNNNSTNNKKENLLNDELNSLSLSKQKSLLKISIYKIGMLAKLLKNSSIFASAADFKKYNSNLIKQKNIEKDERLFYYDPTEQRSIFASSQRVSLIEKRINELKDGFYNSFEIIESSIEDLLNKSNISNNDSKDTYDKKKLLNEINFEKNNERVSQKFHSERTKKNPFISKDLNNIENRIKKIEKLLQDSIDEENIETEDSEEQYLLSIGDENEKDFNKSIESNDGINNNSKTNNDYNNTKDKAKSKRNLNKKAIKKKIEENLEYKIAEIVERCLTEIEHRMETMSEIKKENKRKRKYDVKLNINNNCTNDNNYSKANYESDLKNNNNNLETENCNNNNDKEREIKKDEEEKKIIKNKQEKSINIRDVDNKVKDNSKDNNNNKDDKINEKTEKTKNNSSDKEKELEKELFENFEKKLKDLEQKFDSFNKIIGEKNEETLKINKELGENNDILKSLKETINILKEKTENNENDSKQFLGKIKEEIEKLNREIETDKISIKNFKDELSECKQKEKEEKKKKEVEQNEFLCELEENHLMKIEEFRELLNETNDEISDIKNENKNKNFLDKEIKRLEDIIKEKEERFEMQFEELKECLNQTNIDFMNLKSEKEEKEDKIIDNIIKELNKQKNILTEIENSNNNNNNKIEKFIFEKEEEKKKEQEKVLNLIDKNKEEIWNKLKNQDKNFETLQNNEKIKEERLKEIERIDNLENEIIKLNKNFDKMNEVLKGILQDKNLGNNNKEKNYEEIIESGSEKEINDEYFNSKNENTVKKKVSERRDQEENILKKEENTGKNERIENKNIKKINGNILENNNSLEKEICNGLDKVNDEQLNKEIKENELLCIKDDDEKEIKKENEEEIGKDEEIESNDLEGEKKKEKSHDNKENLSIYENENKNSKENKNNFTEEIKNIKIEIPKQNKMLKNQLEYIIKLFECLGQRLTLAENALDQIIKE